MNIPQKKDAILMLLNELIPYHAKVLKMYFGLDIENKLSVESIGREMDLSSYEVIELKNNAVREFIRLILSTGMFGDQGSIFSEEFLESSQSEFLDRFFNKIMGVTD